MARPLLATFWPELAWLAQPLAGEYAGDRQLFESIPFVRGYGVEIAMLIDIVDRFGVDVIAQADLGRRIHDHQELAALSRMSTEILQVAIERLAAEGRMALTDDMPTLLLQPERDGAGELTMVDTRISPSQRPPLSEWLATRTT